MKKLVGLLCLLSLPGLVLARDDESSAQEVRDRFEAFNEAWKARDMSFVRGFYAHDPDMRLFFERRQLRGWDKVETLYENMFAHARAGSVRSTYSNLQVKARGDMAYVAANFRLQVTNPKGEESTDEGRVSVVFERRGDDWVAVHRHTSFQAPPGPQRHVPLHTEPGPLWSPTLEGAWRDEHGAVLLATASYVSSQGVSSLPPLAKYRLTEEGIWMTSETLPKAASLLVEVDLLTASELVLQLPGGFRRFRRVE